MRLVCLLLVGLCGCAPIAPTSSELAVRSAKLIGTTTYEATAALSPDAVVIVRLVGIDDHGDSVVLGSHRALAAGQQIPFEYAIDYSPLALEHFADVQVVAEIQNGGRAHWSATNTLPASLPSRYDLLLEPVRVTTAD